MSWINLEDKEDRILGKILQRQAENDPDRIFIMADQDRYSFAQVNQLANSYAAGLRDLGIKRDDTVAIFMESCPEFIFAAFGANKLGAIWVPTNIDYKGQWLREALEDSVAKVLFVDATLLPRLAEVASGLQFEKIIVRRQAGEVDLNIPLIDINEFSNVPATELDQSELNYGDTVAVLWTSGTTGRAKGVMQSHNAWIRAAISGARMSGVRDDDILYCCLPLYNSGAWVTAVYRALITGIPMGLDAKFSATKFWDRCRYYKATMIFTLGAMHMFLWHAPELPNDSDNPVRAASMIPIPDDLIGPMKKRFGIDTIDQGYGQSEALGMFTRLADGSRTYAPGSLGDPVEGIEIKLLDEGDIEVPVGEVGEFCIRPTEPNVIFNGYFNNPEATLKAFRNLWYHTGDSGRRDEEGNHFFVDRKADFIRYGGRNISSFAVEAAVSKHPAVKQCAAHGVTSVELEAEAELKVVVVVNEGHQVSADELARFVNDNAPYFFVPLYIEFMEELPQTPTGRVQKYKLRERGVTPETWDRKAAGFVLER
ncbi:AMP-binding protein [Chloroflexota bacterium]